MQTFLAYPDFRQSASVLDRQRLGKQRVEAKQILQCLIGSGSLRWSSHPAVRLWRGHTWLLANYGEVVCLEWIRRGYRDNTLPFFLEALEQLNPNPDKPYWLGDTEFHLRHRSNLLRKLPEHYRRFWPDEPDDLEYIWPE